MSISSTSPTLTRRLPVSTTGPGWIVIAIWLVMLCSFSLPGNDDSAGMGPDAKAKVAIRILLVGVMGLYLLQRTKQSRFRTALKYLWPLLGFALWGILSTVWSPLRNVTLGQAVGMLTLLMIATVIAIEYRGEASTSNLLFYVSIGLIGLSCLLLLARIAVPQAGSMSRDVNGLFHATNASATSSLGILALLASRFYGGWKWTRWMMPTGLVIHTIVLLISQNRVSLVLTSTIVAYIAIRYANVKWRALALVACGLGGVAYIIIDPSLSIVANGMQVFTGFASRDQTAEQLSALSGRAEMWEVMWKSFLTSPLIGHGYFVSSATGSVYVWYVDGNWTAHNLVLQALVTTGIVGTSLLAYGLWRSLGPFLLKYRSTTEARCICLLLFYYAGWAMFNESFLGPLQPESVMFFVLIGLAVGSIVHHTEALRSRAPTTSADTIHHSDTIVS